jgi:hypothetical protein
MVAWPREFGQNIMVEECVVGEILCLVVDRSQRVRKQPGTRYNLQRTSHLGPTSSSKAPLSKVSTSWGPGIQYMNPKGTFHAQAITIRRGGCGAD